MVGRTLLIAPVRWCVGQGHDGIACGGRTTGGGRDEAWLRTRDPNAPDSEIRRRARSMVGDPAS